MEQDISIDRHIYILYIFFSNFNHITYSNHEVTIPFFLLTLLFMRNCIWSCVILFSINKQTNKERWKTHFEVSENVFKRIHTFILLQYLTMIFIPKGYMSTLLKIIVWKKERKKEGERESNIFSSFLLTYSFIVKRKNWHLRQ